jgi:hypothetical protein
VIAFSTAFCRALFKHTIDGTMINTKFLRPLWAARLFILMILMFVNGHASLASVLDTALTVTPGAVFTLQGEGQRAVVYVLTRADSCPSISWGGKLLEVMSLRVAAATLPARLDAAQADNKPAVFDVRTCEATWPQGAHSASEAGTTLSALRADIKRIVIIADTGCRMKASENTFQASGTAVSRSAVGFCARQP